MRALKGGSNLQTGNIKYTPGLRAIPKRNISSAGADLIIQDVTCGALQQVFIKYHFKFVFIH